MSNSTAVGASAGSRLCGAGWCRDRGIRGERPKSALSKVTRRPEATMRADLDTLLTNVNCMADDLLPCKPRRRRRLRVPGAHDGIVLIDSTPVECGRWVETARRSALAPWCANGYRRSHSRQFWAMPLHGAFGPTARPGRGRSRPPTWASGRWPRPRSPRCSRRRGDHRRQGLRLRRLRGRSRRPRRDPVSSRRRDEPGRSPHLAPIRQRIESIFRTCKDILTLERHGARTITGLRARGRVTDAGARRMRIRNCGSGSRRALWVAFIA